MSDRAAPVIGFTEAQWKRFLELDRLREHEVLTPEQLLEFQGLAEESERLRNEILKARLAHK